MVKKYHHKHHGTVYKASPEIVNMELMSNIDSLKSSLTGMRAVLSEAVGVPAVISLNAMNAEKVAPINEHVQSSDSYYDSVSSLVNAEITLPINNSIFSAHKNENDSKYNFQNSVASVISTTDVIELNNSTFVDPKHSISNNLPSKNPVEYNFQDSISSVTSISEVVALSNITFSDPKLGDIEMGTISSQSPIKEHTKANHHHTHHIDHDEMDDIEWREFMNNLCIQPQREMTDGEEQITFARKVTKKFDSYYEQMFYNLGKWWEGTWRSVIFRGKFIDENVTFGQQIGIFIFV